MNKTTGFWYNLFDMPAVYNSVRSVLLFGKGKMFSEITKSVALQEGETLLDVGSGPGELSQLFSNDYAGVDYSQNYVSYSQKKYLGKKFFQGNVLDLSIPEKSYDVVLLASFIHHFSDDEVKKILANMQKVARKRIVLLEPCPWKGNPLAALLLKLDRGAHIRSFEEQKKLVEEYFSIETSYTFTSGMYKLSLIVAQPKVN
ncbi:class I SAM-dependent methyltransferase [Candidatus Woesearchaeota archaeon]|nr:class I SAM-dependent methyltransferase [Candidatus Woesearchaeota archaeon]